jgi:predicted ferric reductase
VAKPRRWPVHVVDVTWIVLLNALLIVGMWVRHGGVSELTSFSGQLTAAGQITALLGTYAVLIQLVLMSRSPWLDQLFGMDHLAVWHRWLGFATVWLLIGHVVFTTFGYSLGDGSTVVGEFWTMLTNYPYVLMATVGMGLFLAVAVTSVRRVRSRVSYETWYGIHLYAYLAVALTFAHQLAVGTDFISDPLARAYWIALYALVAALVLVFRFGQPIVLSVRHQLRVANVVQEAPGVVSVYVTGRELDRLAVQAGQYFLWRFLARDGWWRAHPFSLSAAPNGAFLRLTIKELGDWSGVLQQLRPGTRVFAEGPYGRMTAAARRNRRVLLIAGGIGITPLRALIEELPMGAGAVTLLYRARDWSEVVFRDELDALARLRGARVHFLVGERGSRELPEDPLGPRSLTRLVPAIQQHDIYLCGPTGMMDAVRRTLRTLHVPASHIHSERFAY